MYGEFKAIIQTDTQNANAGRHVGRFSGIYTYRHPECKHTGKQIGRFSGIHTDRCPECKHTERQIERFSGIQTDTRMQTYRQTNRQTVKYTD